MGVEGSGGGRLELCAPCSFPTSISESEACGFSEGLALADHWCLQDNRTGVDGGGGADRSNHWTFVCILIIDRLTWHLVPLRSVGFIPQ